MITGKKKKALEALMICSTRKAAAERAGIDEKTLRAYLRNDEFAAAYNEAFSNIVEEATRQAQQSLSPALDTLREICGDKDAGHAARISAARSLLEYALKLGEQKDLADRVAELERE